MNPTSNAPHSPAPARTRRCSLLIAAALATANFATFAQNESATNATPPEQAVNNAVTAAAQALQPVVTNAATGTTPTTAAATTPEAGVTTGSTTNGIDLNYVRAPIDLVLSHLSDAAGFIVQLDPRARLSGTITVRGKHLTRDEAVTLLNKELVNNGLGAVRSGRVLRIMSKEDIVTSRNPVKVVNSINDVEDNDEVMTAIIPIRFVDANQLLSEVSTFTTATRIVANQAGNSIIVTDTGSNIRHLVEIAKAIDSSAEDVTEVRVFHLDHADPTETASLLTGLFQDQGSGASAPIRLRGGRGGGGGGRGGFGGGGFNPFAAFAAAAGGNNQNSQADRIRQRKQVVAMADPRTRSVVVVASRDLLDQIDGMITQLDHAGRTQQIAVIPVQNGNPNEMVQALQDVVGSRSTSSLNTQLDPFRTRVQQNNQNYSQSVFGNSGFGGNRGGNFGGGGAFR